MGTNGKLPMLMCVLYRNNRDLFVKVTPLMPKTFVLALNKNVCHFEIGPAEILETVLIYIGKS